MRGIDNNNVPLVSDELPIFLTGQSLMQRLAREDHSSGSRVVSILMQPLIPPELQRFHRTLLVEWAYRRAYRSNTARLAALGVYET